MDIMLKTDKGKYQFNEPIGCTILRADGSPFVEEYRNFYHGFLINGRTAYYEGTDRGTPGQHRFEPSLLDYWSAIGTLHPISFQVEVRVGRYPDIVSAISEPVPLSIDLTGIEIMPSPLGEPSWYIKHRNKIYYVWTGSRGHAKPHRGVAADLASAKVLSEPSAYTHYLVDRDSVFRNGVRIKNLSATGFKIFSDVFAGNTQGICTPYGDAKVVKPASFVALDAGDCYHCKEIGENGYRAGYGRDDIHVYWFDCSNSTFHAMVVKACKTPANFVSLDYGYGKDAEHVYFEGRRIKGADPGSWQQLNRLYSRDRKSIFYFTDKVEGADIATFEIAADNDCTPFDSRFARDQFGAFKNGKRLEKQANAID